ncbi:unnamed protein product [Adineta ricciae]|uniref:Uncharacterized protein n=1 Tax=Adineta ricciae TaxID=249248 RepID=A0A814T9K8_ADIRI|nr:unnamed protein product [Adineta ricciae]
MSILNALSSCHSPTLQNPINANSQLVLCINPLLTYKPDTLPTPLITPKASNFFDNNHSHELLQRLRDQKSRLIQFYDTEIDRRQPSSHLSTFLNQIDQLLNEYQSRNTTNAITSKSYPTKLHSSHTNSTSDEPTRPVDDESYSTYFPDGTSFDDSDEIDVCNVQEKATFDQSNEKSSYTDYDDHSYSKLSRNQKHSTKKSTILQLKRYKYEGCCPLTTRTYGLDSQKHGIRHFPCTRVTAPINLYKHLIQYHQLTHSPAMQIVRLLADDNEEGDIDLFSSKANSLIATHPTVYRAKCPLNEYGKFGITAEHKIRLCTQPNQTVGAPSVPPKDVCLYDHFVVYHQMKRSCAQRLAEAIVKNKVEQVFRPDEELLNDTFYVQCPLRHPKSICWKSPISTRHMGQHLTGIHKLDRAARRQIMLTLRKQPSASVSDEN